jgi:hypothetical protein
MPTTIFWTCYTVDLQCQCAMLLKVGDGLSVQVSDRGMHRFYFEYDTVSLLRPIRDGTGSRSYICNQSVVSVLSLVSIDYTYNLL